MLVNLLWTVTIADLLDIVIVSALCYHFICLVMGTKAANLLKGLFCLIAVRIIATEFGLFSLAWLVDGLMTVGLIALIVIFQPELRAALERLGRGTFLFSKVNFEDLTYIKKEFFEALIALSGSKTGAIIVFERKTGLRNYFEAGVRLDSLITSELLQSIFFVPNPLHDGAVLIQFNKIAAAACYLPLSQNKDLPKDTGARHRAALGLSEETDAVTIIVSEETGRISVAAGGKLSGALTAPQLDNWLQEILSETVEDEIKKSGEESLLQNLLAA
jgi:diadenylate cyclase